jgi:soluble lytic murein transglycosylase-like protein
MVSKAMQSANGVLLAQLAKIAMLQSGSNLGSLAPVSTNQALSAALAGAAPPALSPAPTASSQAISPAPAASPPLTNPAPAAAPEEKISLPSPGRRQDIDGLITSTAGRHGVDPHLVRAVITAESDFDPKSVSPVGAMGLMQLMPGTAQDLGVKNAFDPAQNIDGGTRYLAQLLRRFDGDEKKALAAYNWGPGNVERGGRMPEETRNYLQKVSRYKKLYAGGGYSTVA